MNTLNLNLLHKLDKRFSVAIVIQFKATVSAQLTLAQFNSLSSDWPIILPWTIELNQTYIFQIVLGWLSIIKDD